MMVSIGDLVLDVTIVPERRLLPDDDTPATITVGGGGQAANFCAWAARLDEPARLITRVGQDATGARLIADLEADGVEVCAVKAEAEPTGVIAVLVGPDADRTMATMRGASTGLRADDLRSEWFDGVDLLHVPGYSIYTEPIARSARRAVDEVRKHGGRVAVDLSSVAGLLEFGPARMVDELRRIRPQVLFATAAEAETLGAPMDGLAAHAVMKLGPAGAQVGSRRIVAPHVETVDPTGAGDAFAAAFCAAIIHGAGEVEAAERAVEVAAEAVGHAGARPRRKAP